MVLHLSTADIDITAFVKKNLTEEEAATVSLTQAEIHESAKNAAATAAAQALLNVTSASTGVEDEIPAPQESQRQVIALFPLFHVFFSSVRFHFIIASISTYAQLFIEMFILYMHNSPVNDVPMSSVVDAIAERQWSFKVS